MDTIKVCDDRQNFFLFIIQDPTRKFIKKKNLLKIKKVHALIKFFFSENSKKHSEHFLSFPFGYRLMYSNT